MKKLIIISIVVVATLGYVCSAHADVECVGGARNNVKERGEQCDSHSLGVGTDDYGIDEQCAFHFSAERQREIPYVDGYRFACDEQCHCHYCGDRRLTRDNPYMPHYNEECDESTRSGRCAGGKICVNCKCVTPSLPMQQPETINLCGNGTIDSNFGEECDGSKEPCAAGEICSNCKCELPSKIQPLDQKKLRLKRKTRP